MSERNILAYFQTEDQAQTIANRLKSMGINDYQIDEIGKYGGGSSDRYFNPITGQTPGLSNLTLGNINGDVGALADADTAASGMSAADGTSVTGRNILLATIVDESQYEQLRSDIRSEGGLI